MVMPIFIEIRRNPSKFMTRLYPKRKAFGLYQTHRLKLDHWCTPSLTYGLIQRGLIFSLPALYFNAGGRPESGITNSRPNRCPELPGLTLLAYS